MASLRLPLESAAHLPLESASDPKVGVFAELPQMDGADDDFEDIEESPSCIFNQAETPHLV